MRATNRTAHRVRGAGGLQAADTSIQKVLDLEDIVRTAVDCSLALPPICGICRIYLMPPTTGTKPAGSRSQRSINLHVQRLRCVESWIRVN